MIILYTESFELNLDANHFYSKDCDSSLEFCLLENYLPHKDEISIYLQTIFRMKVKFFGQLQRFIAEKQKKNKNL